MKAMRTIRLLATMIALTVVVALAGIAGARAAGTKVGVVALALWSDQGVFRAEATQAARLLAQRYGAASPVVRSNARGAFAAGPKGMVQALQIADATLDPERDVMIVVLTSHGSPEGIAEKGGGVEGILPPAGLMDILGHARVRRKVLIVLACYSGIFTALAGPDTLVVTAADADHPSFGCTAGAKWTYFGRAFFDQALREDLKGHASLDHVFAQAAALVRARELREGFDPSNPQIAGGANVLAALVETPAAAVKPQARATPVLSRAGAIAR